MAFTRHIPTLWTTEIKTMQTTAIQDFGQCPWCGVIHQGECSRVKSKEFYPDGTLKRIEFHDQQAAPLMPVVIQPKLIDDANGDINEKKKEALEHIRSRCPPTDKELTTDDYNWLFGTGRFAQ